MATPKLILLSLAAASTLLTAAPAMADVKTKEVRFADLDLSSPAGRDRLQTRIKQAIKIVCGRPRAITLDERQDLQNCETAAYQKANSQSAQIIAAYMDNRRLAFDAATRTTAN